MPTYRIEQYELHVSAYLVEAASEADAVMKLLDGKGEMIDNSPEFLEPADQYGMPAHDYPGIADMLRSRKHVVGDFIPSIRSIGVV